MELLELLTLIQTKAKDNNLSTPFICGGLPRDKVLGIANDFVDIDITTGDEGSKVLSKKLSTLGHYKDFPDGHSQVLVGNLKIDFSSNYVIPISKNLLQKSGLANTTSLQLELYSRDFTCNTLLMSLDLKTIKDPIGLGITDIKKKLLRTCLPAKITLGSDNKRIVRILYLAAKLNFEVDKEILDWMKINPSLIANVKPKYLKDKLQKAIDYDINKVVKLLDECGLWKYIPLLPELVPYISEKPGRL